jgi:hypothetical protein
MILIQVVLEFVQGFDAKNSEAYGCCIHCGLVSKARLDANNLPQRSHGKCTGTGKKAMKNRKMKRSCPHQSGEGLYILRQLLLPSPLPPPTSTPPPKQARGLSVSSRALSGSKLQRAECLCVSPDAVPSPISDSWCRTGSHMLSG